MWKYFFFLSSPFFLFAHFDSVEISAKSAVLMDIKTGHILYEKNAKEKTFPASLTKIATALFVLENVADLDHKVVVQKQALLHKTHNKENPAPYFLEKGAVTIDLKEGEEVSLKSLVYALLVVTANDAGNVIAEALGGDVPTFMDELNEYLLSIGIEDTYLLNPHGLHHKDHLSTAFDLAALAKRGMEDPLFRKMVSSERYFFPKTNKSDERCLLQTNKLICKDDKHYYPYVFGIKTGYHRAAKANLAVAAECKGRSLILILLGCKNREQRYLDAKRLLEAAFTEKKISQTLLSKKKILSHQIPKYGQIIKASLNEDILYEYYPSEKQQLKAFVHWDSLELPIKKGQKVAEIHVVDENQNVLQKEDVFAKNEVNLSILQSLKKAIGF